MVEAEKNKKQKVEQLDQKVVDMDEDEEDLAE